MKFELKPLEYKYDELEPYFDMKTMIIHHTKHHQAYIDKLNDILDKNKILNNLDLNSILEKVNSLDSSLKKNVRFFAGGAANHDMFWAILKKDIKLPEAIKNAIDEQFGDLKKFKELFKENAMSLQGSGWTWLVINNGKLEVMNTSNHDNPISEGIKPLLLLDMWEHAYYLKYQNRKSEFIDAFFNIINWEKVNENFLENKRGEQDE